ncbi:phage holin family protein [Candidatus Nanoperiomorbus periodonticus]|uniref:phage holin family protein n=1 Tax=Candidatus Nanoperiomorbus periodonticus TaxID=2171989 RepID=UPI00101BDDC9|nr:phage holin family protein [Candidatus Nanoperiomorbus periodonticus]MBB1556377.1 phage holin family protein [Candidatus Saccharibacteria bacterium]MCG5079171.1 phage holin family protein [Candidatus Saccharibacteria bacterium]TWO87024.1 phage holin family protein [TM7 phylum sp. oral taxon 356]
MERTLSFTIRWFVCALGLWVAVQLFGYDTLNSIPMSVATFLLAGLVFSAINAIVKPVVTALSLPFVLVTMGLFTLVINGLMIWLTIAMLPNIHMSFGWAIVSSLILSLLNYLLNNLTPIELNQEKV